MEENAAAGVIQPVPEVILTWGVDSEKGSHSCSISLVSLFCLSQIASFWLFFNFYEPTSRGKLPKMDSDWYPASFHFILKSHRNLFTIRSLSGEHNGSQFVNEALQMFPGVFFKMFSMWSIMLKLWGLMS